MVRPAFTRFLEPGNCSSRALAGAKRVENSLDVTSKDTRLDPCDPLEPENWSLRFSPTSVLVTTSKALVTSSDARPSS